MGLWDTADPEAEPELDFVALEPDPFSPMELWSVGKENPRRDGAQQGFSRLRHNLLWSCLLAHARSAASNDAEKIPCALRYRPRFRCFRQQNGPPHFWSPGVCSAPQSRVKHRHSAFAVVKQVECAVLRPSATHNEYSAHTGKQGPGYPTHDSVPRTALTKKQSSTLHMTSKSKLA